MEEKRSWWQKSRLHSWWQKIRSGLGWWWQQIKQHRVATALVVLFFILVVLVLLGGYLFHWDWTGINSQENKTTTISTPQGTYKATEMQSEKNLWDWLQLLAVLAIPIVVGLGAAWYTAQQGKVSDRENTDNQRETALQTYIDKMSELLLKEHLGELSAKGKPKPGYERVQKIARVRTLTVLRRLDTNRKASVLKFLHESGLIYKDKYIIDLDGADLIGANLEGVKLEEADLFGADLSKAILGFADLRLANLREANLSRANLSGVILSRADLSYADLSSRAILCSEGFRKLFLGEAILNNANLSNANLSNANLSEAILSNANLSEAILKDASGIAVEELEKQTNHLKDATMPDGSIHD